MREFLTSLPRYVKRIIALAFDIFCIWLSVAAALTLRLGDFNWLSEDNYSWWQLAIAAPLSAIPFFVRLGLYRAVLRYINSVALTTILKAVLFSTISLLIIDRIILVDLNLPRSFPFLYFLNLSILMIGSRFLMQRWLLGGKLLEVLFQLFKNPLPITAGFGKRALVYGEGEAVLDLVVVLDRTREYQPVAIIDQQGSSVGGEICGKPIYGVDDIESVIEKFEPHEILLALPSASKSQRKPVIQFLEKFGLPIKTMPSSEDLASGRMKLQDVQDVDIADVLGREEVEPNADLLSVCIKNKVVMITGAGGSIGSEITRQVIKYSPTRVIIVDHSEFNLYTIDREIRLSLETLKLNIDFISVLASVTDQLRLSAVMRQFEVNTVYHAAAYKHVPIVEQNISQGIINNVYGTVSAAQAAIDAKVEHFVLISTDKAVRPSNVMGASKRLAELALQALSNEKSVSFFDTNFSANHANITAENNTRFCMVRFGNVLGSSGSVIPLFKEQIRIGGPITVTHPDINRYFMSIPEAAQLVLQAGAMGQGGDVFVLDMGEPIKIIDLAKRMVQLSGLSVISEENPEGDIAIHYSGLRAGEKLYEELLIGDNPQETDHPRIFKANEECLTWDEFKQVLQQLNEALVINDYQKIRALLQNNISGFTPDTHIVDWLSAPLH